MNLDLLSKYRTPLMGLAIMGVMFFHSSFPVEYYSILGFIKNNGYIGVEIFFLLSGFGIYFSISKSTSIKEFYKKRVLRILPYYLPIVLLYSILCMSVGYWTFKDLLYSVFLVGFWVNNGFDYFFDWYIPAILLMYLITPAFYYFYKKNKVLTMLVFCSVSLLAITFNNFIIPTGIDYLYLFLYRIPLYFIGFAIADFLMKNKNYTFTTSSIIIFAIMLIGALVPMCYLYSVSPDWSSFTIYGRQMFFCLIIVFPLCLFLAYFFSLFKNYKYPILTFLGTYTLTIYIFHERILKINMFWLGKYIENNDLYLIIFNIAVIITTLIVAVWWQKFVDRILHKLESKKISES